MTNYRNYNRQHRCGRLYEDDNFDDVPEVLTWVWVKSHELRDVTDVVIPYGVKRLDDNCFYGCNSLVKITIPSSVTEIGENCFAGCTSLNSITIPNSVTKIGEGCFYDCTSLKSVVLPNSITSLGYECFLLCTSLKSVTLSNSVKNVHTGCFRDCHALKDVYYAGSVDDYYAMRIDGQNEDFDSAFWHFNSTGMNERLTNRYSRPYYSHNSTRPIREGINRRPYYRSRYGK